MIKKEQFIEMLKTFLYHAGTTLQLGKFIPIIMESLHLFIRVKTTNFLLPNKNMVSLQKMDGSNTHNSQ